MDIHNPFHYQKKMQRNPIRDRDVLYTGVANYRSVIENGTLPMENTEDDRKAVCMSRSFDMAMVFANMDPESGGVLALDRKLLRQSFKIECHQDLVLCHQTRSHGYSEAEERIYSEIPNLKRYMVASWEGNAARRMREAKEEVCSSLDITLDELIDGGQDWDAAFSNENCLEDMECPEI